MKQPNGSNLTISDIKAIFCAKMGTIKNKKDKHFLDKTIKKWYK